ncbi:MAG: transketolase [Chloroflexi bacterium]|nr:transketolase [Chloroflexota bacterium]MBV9543557.1 transketolase [Chloroflexota bacterium]
MLDSLDSTRLETRIDLSASHARCARLRKRILELSQGLSAIHIGGAFSCLELVETIYFSLMKRDANGQFIDTFLLSKGHGSPAQYVVLEELGILSHDDLETMCKPNGRLGTHPDYGLPGIQASTGSLGHGLALGMGMALADRIHELDRTIYVVMSDGELQEGSVWEAMMLAPTLGLSNVVAFVDLNDMQSFGHTSQTHPNFYPVLDKVRAFGWEAVEIDGHDQSAIFSAVTTRRGASPFMAIARTTKGKGVSYMENVPMWHYRSPSPAEYEQALAELSTADV